MNEYYPDLSELTREIVLRWMEKRPTEKASSQQARAERRVFAPGNPYFFTDTAGGTFSGAWLNKQFQKCWAAANPGQASDDLPGARCDIELKKRCACSVVLTLDMQFLTLKAKANKSA